MQMHEQRDTTSSEKIYTAKDSRKTRKKLFSTSETKLKSEHVDFCTGFFFGGDCETAFWGATCKAPIPQSRKRSKSNLAFLDVWEAQS